VTTNPPPLLGPSLTSRELEVLAAAADGRTVAHTARHLFIGERTVKEHRARIVAALGARSIAHAVAIGFRQRLLT
jgi:DNA-binding NarL/FixJ family response regulator